MDSFRRPSHNTSARTFVSAHLRCAYLGEFFVVGLGPGSTSVWLLCCQFVVVCMSGRPRLELVKCVCLGDFRRARLGISLGVLLSLELVRCVCLGDLRP